MKFRPDDGIIFLNHPKLHPYFHRFVGRRGQIISGPSYGCGGYQVRLQGGIDLAWVQPVLLGLIGGTA